MAQKGDHISNNLSDQVYNKLKGNILSGVLKPEQKLPSENKLASIYDVSRLTIRNALQRLKATGLIQTHNGDGSYVSDLNIEKQLGELSKRMLAQGTMNDVLAFRKVIEIECIKMMIEKATQEELTELEARCIKYSELLPNTDISDPTSINDLTQADYNIHFYICKLSKNPLFELSYIASKQPIQQYLQAVLVFRLTIYTNLLNIPKEEDQHLLLCRAIQKRDAKKSCKIAADLINYEFFPLNFKEKITNERLSVIPSA